MLAHVNPINSQAIQTATTLRPTVSTQKLNSDPFTRQAVGTGATDPYETRTSPTRPGNPPGTYRTAWDLSIIRPGFEVVERQHHGQEQVDQRDHVAPQSLEPQDTTISRKTKIKIKFSMDQFLLLQHALQFIRGRWLHEQRAERLLLEAMESRLFVTVAARYRGEVVRTMAVRISSVILISSKIAVRPR